MPTNLQPPEPGRAAAAKGMSNKEIAAALFLSPKTVEHHQAKGVCTQLQNQPPTNAMASATSTRQVASSAVKLTHSFMGLPFPAS